MFAGACDGSGVGTGWVLSPTRQRHGGAAQFPPQLDLRRNLISVSSVFASCVLAASLDTNVCASFMSDSVYA